MNVATLLDSAVSHNLTMTLVHFVWQGAAIAVASLLIAYILRRRSAQVRYAVHLGTLLLMIACLPATFAVVANNEAAVDARLESSTVAADSRAASNSAMELNAMEELQRRLRSKADSGAKITDVENGDSTFPSTRSSEMRLAGDASTSPSNSNAATAAVANTPVTGWGKIASAIPIVYLLGVFLMCGRLVLAVWGGKRLRRDALVSDEPAIVAAIRQAASQLRMRHVPVVAFAHRVSSPVVLGVLRPIVLLPTTLMPGLTPDQFRAILAHEFAHIRRYDHVILVMQRLVEALLFFHPAVWLVSRQIRIERERCCDDAVVTTGTRRVTYVESLVRVAELRLLSLGKDLSGTASLAAVRDPSQLRRRIARLVGEPIEPVTRLNSVGTLALCLLVGAILLSPAILPSHLTQPVQAEDNDQDVSTHEDSTDSKPQDKPKEFDPKKTRTGGSEDKPTQSSINISKKTTFITAPLTDDGYADFRAAINKRFSNGVTAENNAVVPLLQAMGPRPENFELPDEFYKRLGVERLADKGDYIVSLYDFTRSTAANSKPPKDFDELWSDVDKQWDRAMDQPWQAKDSPIIHLWLNKNEKPLTLTIQATKRPRYYHPWVSKGGLLIAQPMPMVQKHRQVARLLQIRAMLKIGSGDLEGAWNDLLAMHRLGRLVARGPTLIDSLIGIAIDNIACHSDQILAQHGKMTGKLALRIQEQLATLPPVSDIVECLNYGERLSYLDLAQYLAHNPQESVSALKTVIGEYYEAAEWMEENATTLDKLAKEVPVDWSEVMRRGNVWFDRIVAKAREPDYEKREQSLKTLFAEFDETHKVLSDLSALAKSLPADKKERKTLAAKYVADGMAALLTPAVNACTNAETRSRSWNKAARLAFAVAAYHHQHGSYPTKLDQLTPNFIDKIPTDPLGNDIVFAPDAKGYSLTIRDPAKIYDVTIATPDRRKEQ